MLKTAIRILRPYLLEMRSGWTLVSFALALFTLAVLKKRNSAHRYAISFTVLWLGLVYTSTVLSRSISYERGWALMPLWSYDQWLRGNDVFLTYIVLNILMLLPIGVSLSSLYPPRRTMLLGFLFSCFIECSQLLTGRGLFEIDDILHNTLGVYLGVLVYRGFWRLRAGRKTI